MANFGKFHFNLCESVHDYEIQKEIIQDSINSLKNEVNKITIDLPTLSSTRLYDNLAKYFTTTLDGALQLLLQHNETVLPSKLRFLYYYERYPPILQGIFEAVNAINEPRFGLTYRAFLVLGQAYIHLATDAVTHLDLAIMQEELKDMLICRDSKYCEQKSLMELDTDNTMFTFSNCETEKEFECEKTWVEESINDLKNKTKWIMSNMPTLFENMGKYFTTTLDTVLLLLNPSETTPASQLRSLYYSKKYPTYLQGIYEVVTNVSEPNLEGRFDCKGFLVLGQTYIHLASNPQTRVDVAITLEELKEMLMWRKTPYSNDNNFSHALYNGNQWQIMDSYMDSDRIIKYLPRPKPRRFDIKLNAAGYISMEESLKENNKKLTSQL